jgi:hypothetical protein
MLQPDNRVVRGRWDATARSMVMAYRRYVVYGYAAEADALEGMLNSLLKLDLWLRY